MSSDARRLRGSCLVPGVLLLAVLVPACGSGPPSLLDVPLDEWPLRHLETYGLESPPVLEELRARAARNTRSEEVLDRVYDQASVLAFSGDEPAYEILVAGVRSGDRSALFRYGEFLLSGASAFNFNPQPENALRSLLRAQGLGSEMAAEFLCEGFIYGWDGYRPVLPPPGGRALCEANARTGAPDAVRLLGDLHRLGVDQPPEPHQAFQFYLVAGSAGSGRAMYEIGRLAQSGVEGIPPDLRAASGYFIRAVQYGEPLGLMPAITLLETGPPGVGDLVQAFTLWEQAWDQGLVAGAWGMSRAFRCGLGVSVSPVESRYWTDVASAVPDPDPATAAFGRSTCPTLEGMR